MKSVSEIATAVNAANTELASARSSIVQAQDSIERARQAIGELLADASSDRLWDYIGTLNNAESKANSMIYSVEGAMTQGQDYIATLYS